MFRIGDSNVSAVRYPVDGQWRDISSARFGDQLYPLSGASGKPIDLLDYRYVTERTVTTTITAALAELAAEIRGQKFHPTRRHLIRIPPGTYQEKVQTNLQYIDLVGDTGNPADVLIVWPNGASDPIRQYPLEWQSAVTLKHVTVEAGYNSYCIHADGSTLDASMQTYENVRFIGPHNTPTGLGTPVGGIQYFKDCVFDTSTAGKRIYPIFGHSSIGTDTSAPGRTIFDGCTYVLTPGGPIAQWTHWPTGQADELWIDNPGPGSSVDAISGRLDLGEREGSTRFGRYFVGDQYTNAHAHSPEVIEPVTAVATPADRDSAWWIYWSGRSESQLSQGQ